MRGLLLAANVGEEGEGNLLGMRTVQAVALARKIDAFVVVDGANTDHITTRALGSRRFEVTFTGPGGHSWSDYGVANPLHALCRAVALFSETRLDTGPKSSINVGLIEGGTSINAIAQSRAPRSISARKATRKMEELVDLLAARSSAPATSRTSAPPAGRVTVKLREIGARPAAALPDSAPILQYVRAVDAHLGIRSHLDTSSTDANIPLSLGIPARGDRGGRAGRRRAHHAGVVPARKRRDLGLKRIFLIAALAAAERRDARSEPSPARTSALLLQYHRLGRHLRPGKKLRSTDISPILFLALRFTLAAAGALPSSFAVRCGRCSPGRRPRPARLPASFCLPASLFRHSACA